MTGRGEASFRSYTNIEPVMTNGVVIVITGSVESGMTTPGPVKDRVLSRANHHALIVMPLKVASPIPLRRAVLLGKMLTPGLQPASPIHGDRIPCVTPSTSPPLAAKPFPEKLKATSRNWSLLRGAPPIETNPLVIVIPSARAVGGNAKKQRARIP